MDIKDLLTRAFDEAVREKVKEQTLEIIDAMIINLNESHSIITAIDCLKGIKERLKNNGI